jgi:hypothetical protein
MKPCAGGRQVSGSETTIGPDINNFFLGPYGCVIGDETFEIETEFMNHSYHHYCDDPQKDTYLELFEIRLLSYIPCKQETE